MDANYSLSDIAAISGNKENGMFGAGNGGMWIFALLILLLIGGGGFLGNRNNHGDYGQFATAATQQEILFGQQFGQINERINNLGNGICSLGYDMKGNICNLGKEVALGQAGINQQIMQGNYNIAQQLADYCCKTQRGIDAVNANIEAKFAALEKSQLEQRIAQLEQNNNQLYIAQQMNGIVRYPTSYTYSAGNSPFCGGCNGCCG